MTVMRLPVFLLLAGVLSLAGCTRYQQTPLYQLDGGNLGVPTGTQGVAVLLGPISIADYLQREALLQRQLDGSLTSAEGARWAGNLASEIDQQLLRQLAARLNSQNLVLAPAAPGFAPQVRVALAITRLDSGPERPAVLEAQWRLSAADGTLLDGRLVRLEEAHRGAIVDQVRAQSLVVQQLVEQLAQAVEEYGNPPPVAVKPAPKPAPAKPAPRPAVPRIPVAEPNRDEAEVFRF
ncbi:membrane integrity-associated transporter subunit PqiC [Pseudomonas sp.]|uniref:PqiC family protein n=1 Tax=Pseudomonas sp. TaxID=306 RepID=UPI002736F284|nr:ABC-type transport auxiliary lipoprotein family protein [Pseudomonas sp.]MDP3815458.1 ABC-type transport auxiliary lipoprotein family protein [Pseudomonas sp.]